MISTVAKQKLPKFLAYPIGAQVLSNAVAGVQQFDELELWFSRHDYGCREIDGNHIVLTVRYTKINHGLSAAHYLDESGYYGPRWAVTVYAVPRPLNSAIRNALRNNGLSQIREWLATARTATWLSSSHHFTHWYCPDADALEPESDD